VLREAVFVTTAILVYFGVRNVTAGAPDKAFANAQRVLDAEQHLGLSWEHAMQGAIIGSHALVTFANWIYIWGHWPVILASAIALFALRREHYRILRTTIVLSGLVGFAFFALFPVAPPRLSDPGLVDTISAFSNSYRTLQPPGLTNQYAAMPSLHFGWNLAVGIALFTAFESRVVRAFAVTLPVLMALAVIMTANHFVLDVLAGGTLVLATYAIALSVSTDRAGTLGARDLELGRVRPLHATVRRRASRR
jgi:PAP2 superfamily